MNELVAIGVIAAYMAVAYLVVYPRASTVVGLRWMDLVFSVLAIGSIGAIFWSADPVFSLLFFETNWLVFALVGYVILETPLWYLYMKAHPQQGTLAELYGMASKQNQKVAKSMETVMNDTKWDALRTSQAQRILVALGTLSLIASPLVFWFEDAIQPGIGILTLVPIFLIWWLTRLSVRLVADAPDEYLDELQLQQRDRTYLHAFRILAGIVSALAIALMIFVISMDAVTVGDVQTYQLSLTFGQIQAVIWGIFGSTILVPNLVLAWNQAKRVQF